MRMAARHLGIGQTIPTLATPTYVGPVQPTITPVYAIAPSLPSGYDSTLPTGAIPGNESGQTIDSLAANSVDLCAQQGGTWNATTNTCSMCPQNAFAALFTPETWDPTSGTCSSSYTPLIIAGGGLAVLVLLVTMISKK